MPLEARLHGAATQASGAAWVTGDTGGAAAAPRLRQSSLGGGGQVQINAFRAAARGVALGVVAKPPRAEGEEPKKKKKMTVRFPRISFFFSMSAARASKRAVLSSPAAADFSPMPSYFPTPPGG